MSTTLAGHPLLALSLVIPRIGAWTADVEVDSDADLTGVVALDLEGRVWQATVVRGAVAYGRWSGRLVGAGGLLAERAPLALQDTTLRGVLDELAREAGVTLATTTGDLSAAVARWHRSTATGAQEVAEVALRAGMTWRVFADGTVWVGAETWPDATLGADLDVMDHDPVAARYELAGGAALDVRPGTLAQLRVDAADVFVRVGAVHHRLEGVALRTSLLEERDDVAPSLAGRLMAALEAIVGRVTRRFDRQGAYAARVVAQEANGGRLDIEPEDPRRPSAQRVPYRTLPGLVVEIPVDSRVSYTYEDGDPRRPLVVLWEPATTAGKWSVYGGTTKVARDGESVNRSTGMGAWITAVSTALNTPGAVIGAPGTVTPPVGAIGAVSGGCDVVRVP